MWQALLEEMDRPLETVMAVLGIPLWDKDLGEKAAEALEARLAGLEPLRGDLPGEVRARVEALAELLLHLGAEAAFRRWMDGYRAKRRVLGLGEDPGEAGTGPGSGEEPPGRGPGGGGGTV